MCIRDRSSTNRSPRKTTQGTSGEVRDLRLELQILADVGLLGMPNAGKSSLLRAVSEATPKVADYPFTTMYPSLGVVRVDDESFVIADIPGLIEGAADGAGLGIEFLKHLSRTNLLLHIVDIFQEKNKVYEDIKKIRIELERYDEKLSNKENWLVLNKSDLTSKEDNEMLISFLKNKLEDKIKIFVISAISSDGCQELIYKINNWMLKRKEKNE